MKYDIDMYMYILSLFSIISVFEKFRELVKFKVNA